MAPFKSVSSGGSARSVSQDQNVYFELHKLWSEQQRLEQMRATLSERIRLIDIRVAEIAQAMNAIDPRRRR